MLTWNVCGTTPIIFGEEEPSGWWGNGLGIVFSHLEPVKHL